MKVGLCLVCFVSLLLSACLPVQRQPRPFLPHYPAASGSDFLGALSLDVKRLETLVHEAILANELVPETGVAVSVVRNGEFLWQGAWGYRDQHHHWPVTTETRFPLASLSKTFSSWRVMTLQQEQKLSIHQPLRTWLPDLVSGEDPALADLTLEDILSSQKSTVKESLAYKLVDAVIEKVSAIGWEKDLRQSVFVPLGWKRDSFSVTEMARWVTLHAEGGRYLDQEFLSPASFATLTRARTEGQALGWHIRGAPGSEVFFQSENMEGFLSLMVFIPSRHLGWVILTNQEQGPLIWKLSEAIEKAL